MKPLTVVPILLFAILTGCALPPAGPLILTKEDLILKQKRSSCPDGIYVCPGHKVEVSK
jgi:hypothetical protein